MIEQQATVSQTNKQTIWLQAERHSSCDGCQVKQGCGTGLLANHVGKRFSQIRVENNIDVAIGQQVKLAIPEQSLLQGAALMYLLPLVLLFVFAALVKMTNLSEIIEIFAGLSGLFIGFCLVRIRLQNHKNIVQAKIVEIVEER